MTTLARSGSPRRATTIGIAATVVSGLPLFFTAAMGVQLAEELGFGEVGMGSAVAAFFGTTAISSVYLGRVADHLGATLSLRIATGASAVAALGIALGSRDWLTLVAWLVLAGVAASLAQPAANRLLVNSVQRARLGTAFGLKQSASPVASMLAGISVPAIALTVGWRWAFAIGAVGALVVAIAVGPRPSTASRRVARPGRNKREPLRDPSTLAMLAVGFGLAFAASSTVLAFYVDAAVRAGGSPHLAGLVFGAASLAAIVTRLAAGMACDRYALRPLQLCAVLLGLGAIGLGLLATGRPFMMALGAVVGLAGTWGFPGVFWFALVRAYPEAPGRVTGAMAPATIGGSIGPVGFGALASSVSYPLAWTLAGALSLIAAGVMAVAARRLPGGR